MKPILDATAGNRHLWKKNKKPDNVVFLDKELRLRVPPDIFSVWRHLPFRNDVFHCVIYDPPHVFSETSQFNRDPKARPHGQNKIPGWYGAFKSKRDAVIQLWHAQREFARVAPRMCFKWNEASMKLWNVLGLFDCWKAQIEAPAKHLRSVKTWWVKLIRSSLLHETDECSVYPDKTKNPCSQGECE